MVLRGLPFCRAPWLSGFAMALSIALFPLPFLGEVAATNTVEVKHFALDPAQYVGKKVELFGTVRTIGPAHSWFLLEDHSGKVLVTTAQSGSLLLCDPGSTARVSGELTYLGDEFGLYFAMSELLSCSPTAESIDGRFALWLHRLSHFFNGPA